MICLKKMSVPIGELYYAEDKAVRYRWINENVFEFFYNGKLLSANSVDWDFI